MLLHTHTHSHTHTPVTHIKKGRKRGREKIYSLTDRQTRFNDDAIVYAVLDTAPG